VGIKLGLLDDLRLKGVLKSGCAVLDIGSSNLYSADSESIRSFLAHYNIDADMAFIGRLSAGSAYGSDGGSNESWAGELLEKAGMTYLAFDIANGFRTQIFDLNQEALPQKHRGAFDVVLNFGTTEHVINQLNAFRIIHDAVKVGGVIVHQLPCSGYIDHGYFCYTPRFFFDLAGHNEYEVVEFCYDGPRKGANIFGIVNDYKSYFPALRRRVYQEGLTVQDLVINIILRKTKNLPLRLPIEKSTSVVR